MCITVYSYTDHVVCIKICFLLICLYLLPLHSDPDYHHHQKKEKSHQAVSISQHQAYRHIKHTGTVASHTGIRKLSILKVVHQAYWDWANRNTGIWYTKHTLQILRDQTYWNWDHQGYWYWDNSDTGIWYTKHTGT